ncbi:sensor histidine kinase [Actinomadura alba]|uniref:sensor histidine kinase n=1 Tax=Actinomadura alba TaxID=406431 RepID=UPI0028A72D76|nr:HAMP domain-containing sensor histidine kinase [Actinomadura alba]
MRLTVVASVVMALICTAVAVFILIAVRTGATDYRTEQLVANAVQLIQRTRSRGGPALRPETSGTEIQMFTPSGVPAAATPNLAGKPPMVNFHPDPDSYVTKRLCDLPAFPGECKIVIDIPFHMPDGLWRLYMATPEVPWYISFRLLGPLVACWLLLIAVTARGAYHIVGKTLAPVHAISGKLATITAGDLDQRVPVPKVQDELKDLAETANQTLERAQAAIQQQLQFASDASHDLRSPLTAMRTQIEEALLHPRDTDWRETGNALLSSVEWMQDLVADLLQLCRLDAGIHGRHDAIDLTALVTCELDRRPRKVTIGRRLTPTVIINGDRLGLTRLLTNLLDNAERHAASSVTVAVAHQQDTAVLEVTNDGEGIPPDQREIVFQRFVRLGASRAKDAGGTGLGLPIARRIAQAHGGTLTIEDSDHGARFVLRLPLPDLDNGSTHLKRFTPQSR